LRGSLGGRGVVVGLSTGAGVPDAPPVAISGLAAAARAVPGVASVESVDHRLIIGTADPATVTPAVVRTLVAAGADIVDVRERATTLEQVYFEVMGVRPDRGEAA
jgi:hypothetical protein